MENERESDDVLMRIRSTYEFRSKTLEYSTLFYSDRFMILHKNRKVGEILYDTIMKVSRNRGGLKFNLNDGSDIRIPCMDDEKREIFKMFKKTRSVDVLNLESIIGLAFVEFADLQFLIPLDNMSFVDFKKNVIRRVGGYFFPSWNLDFVSLDHYDEFCLYLKKDDSFVIFENDEDLVCALLYFDKRLNVMVKHVPKELL